MHTILKFGLVLTQPLVYYVTSLSSWSALGHSSSCLPLSCVCSDLLLLSPLLVCTHATPSIQKRKASKLGPGPGEGGTPSLAGLCLVQRGAHRCISGLSPWSGSTQRQGDTSKSQGFTKISSTDIVMVDSGKIRNKVGARTFFSRNHKTPGTVNINFFKIQHFLLRGNESINLSLIKSRCKCVAEFSLFS